MPIRHFDFYISERQLIQTSPISQLKGAKIGIEGQYWLRKIIKPSIARVANPEAKILDNISANIVAMGGTFPYSTFKLLLEREINKIRSLDIYPFFVFNGLPFFRKDRPFTIEDTRPNKRASGWDHYEKGRLESAFNTWSSSGSVHQNEFMNSVFKIFHENHVEFMRGPYSSWAQLAYLEHRGLIQSTYSGSEMLMWSGDNDIIILNIDFDRKEFTWIDKMRVMHDLNMVNPDQFIDVCMLAGFDWISTFPPLVGGGPNGAFTFKGTVELIAQYKTGYNAIQAFAEHPNVKKMNYEDTFCRIKSIIKHNIVLKEDGTVEPLNKEMAPNDLHDLFGPRLADEVYFYLCQGIVSPQVITNLVSGMLLEGPPLCNGDTNEYREFIRSESLLQLRTQALSLLTSGMSSYMRNRHVNSIFWFDPSHEIQLHHEKEPIGTRWLPPYKQMNMNENSKTQNKENISEENYEESSKDENSKNKTESSGKPIYSLTNNIDWIENLKKKDKDSIFENINIQFCLQTVMNTQGPNFNLSIPTFQSNTKNSKNSSSSANSYLSPFDLKYVCSVEDIYGIILLRFLEARNYIKLNMSKALTTAIPGGVNNKNTNSNNNNNNNSILVSPYQLTSYGKALYKALNMPNSTTFQEEIISALELIRMKILNNKNYTRIPYVKPGNKLSSPIHTTSPQSQNKEVNEVQAHINLISRVASLLHINFKPMVVWNGPLVLELVRFNSFAKSVNRSLRNLFEMLLLAIVMNENAGKFDINLEVINLGVKLPFLLDANTANGIITKTYLDGFSDIVKITPEIVQKNVKSIESKFSTYCANVMDDMKATYQLWDHILEAVKCLKSDGQISSEYADEFINANEWLKDKRPVF